MLRVLPHSNHYVIQRTCHEASISIMRIAYGLRRHAIQDR